MRDVMRDVIRPCNATWLAAAIK